MDRPPAHARRDREAGGGTLKEIDMKSITRLLGSIGLALAVTALPVVASDAQPGPSSPKITPTELVDALAKKDADVVVLDVRTPEEFAAGHVPGARNIPHGQLASRLAELADARDKKIVLYCRSGRRASIAEGVLKEAGFTQLRHLEGDFPAWESAQRPVEK
jgi:phage shock protein E